LRALGAALSDQGKPAPASIDLPRNVKVVDMDTWRQHAYRAGVSASNEDRARQQAFKRAAESLIGNQHVRCCDALVWLG
jgi:hypothetical protein